MLWFKLGKTPCCVHVDCKTVRHSFHPLSLEIVIPDTNVRCTSPPRPSCISTLVSGLVWEQYFAQQAHENMWIIFIPYHIFRVGFGGISATEESLVEPWFGKAKPA